MDDRKERPGVMFADMELIGIPHTVVIGVATSTTTKLKYKYRRDGEKKMIKTGDYPGLPGRQREALSAFALRIKKALSRGPFSYPPWLRIIAIFAGLKRHFPVSHQPFLHRTVRWIHGHAEVRLHHQQHRFLARVRAQAGHRARVWRDSPRRTVVRSRSR